MKMNSYFVVKCMPIVNLDRLYLICDRCYDIQTVVLTVFYELFKSFGSLYVCLLRFRAFSFIVNI